MRLCRAIDPPVGCLYFRVFVFMCVRLFNRIFYRLWVRVSRLQHLFSRGFLHPFSWHPLRSLLSRALVCVSRSLSGLLAEECSFFICFDIFSNFIILSLSFFIFMMYEILIGFYVLAQGRGI